MSNKAACPICDSYTSGIYDTGICPNGCTGRHAFEDGYMGEFCARCHAHRDAIVHRSEVDLRNLRELHEKARALLMELEDLDGQIEAALAEGERRGSSELIERAKRTHKP